MFAVIYIPDFSLQAILRAAPELSSAPVGLIDERLAKGKVCQITAAARVAGVAPGQTSTQSLARCPEMIFKIRSEIQDACATDALLQCAGCFSPNIENTAPGICTLDLKGLPVALAANDAAPCPDSNRPVQWWAEKIMARLAALHLHARIGVADKPGTAWQAARLAQAFLHVQNAGEFTAGLPIESLDPPPDILEVLHRWGIRALGQFVALGKDKIAERLGAEGLELFARAVADSIRPLDLVKPKPVFEESIEIEHEIETLEPLLFILRRFIEQLSCRLELFCWVAEEIQMRLRLASGANYERRFRVPAPTRDIDVLFRMLQTHLENVRTDSPIVALQLAANPGRPEHFQFGLFETALRDPNHFYQTLAQLNSLLGTDRVGSPWRENSHRPDAFQMVAPRFESAPVSTARLNEPSAPGTDQPPQGLALRRFRPPLPATVELREGRPAICRGRNLGGAITKARGPFRSSGQWWEQEQLWNRDEWDVETARGELLRIFVERGEWFVEGFFD
jgi:protein ImuB